ncbi:zinc finger protein CONSTANS [Capsicum galapagoense]
MNIKKCELCCKKRARMYCESDEASLCFDCDSNVHSANFLVAKHSRNLLCHSCSNTTPWSASGPKLSPTLSICNSCIENPSTVQLRNAVVERVEENYQLDTYDDHSDDEYVSSSDDESDIDDDENCEDDGNQVVPLPSSSSLSGAGDGGGAREEGGGGGCCSSSPWKRLRETDCLHSEDEKTCSSAIGFVRPMKALRTNELCE